MVLVSGRNDTFKPLLREITLKEWRKLQMEPMLLQGLASVEQVHIHFSVETSFLAHRCTITFLPWGQKKCRENRALFPMQMPVQCSPPSAHRWRRESQESL